MTKPLKNIIRNIKEIGMWPYTDEENDFLSTSQKQDDNDWDYDTYGHGA